MLDDIAAKIGAALGTGLEAADLPDWQFTGDSYGNLESSADDEGYLARLGFNSGDTSIELPLLASYNLKRGDVIRLVVSGSVGAAADFSTSFILPVATEEA